VLQSFIKSFTRRAFQFYATLISLTLYIKLLSARLQIQWKVFALLHAMLIYEHFLGSASVVELVKALKAFNQNIQARLSPYVVIKHASSSTKMALIAMKLGCFYSALPLCYEFISGFM
jgi:hypothetical protein